MRQSLIYKNRVTGDYFALHTEVLDNYIVKNGKWKQAFIQDFLLGGGGNFFGVTNQPRPSPQDLCSVSFNEILDIFKEKNRRIQL